MVRILEIHPCVPDPQAGKAGGEATSVEVGSIGTRGGIWAGASGRRWRFALFGRITTAAVADPQVTLRAGKRDNPNHGLAMEFAASAQSAGKRRARNSGRGEPGLGPERDRRGARARRSLFTAPPNVIAEARRGDKPYGKSARYQDIRALFPIPFQTMHWVVRQDSGIMELRRPGRSPVHSRHPRQLGERHDGSLKILGLDNKLQLIDIDAGAASGH